MAIVGISNLLDQKRPSLWNVEEMKRIELADGATFDQVVADLRAACQLANAELLTMPHYSGMIAVQDDVTAEYAVGNSNEVEAATEHGVPVSQQGKTTGHSIPTKPWDYGLGYTMMSLRKSRGPKRAADIAAAGNAIRKHFQKRLLRRFFLSTAEAVGGTASLSVPFADGGTADSNFIPPDSMRGASFANTHTHFLRLDGITMANLETAIAHLFEHDIDGPYDLIVSETDLSSWTNLSGWKNPQYAGINFGTQQDRAELDSVMDFFSYIETDYGIARVWSNPRLSTKSWGVYRSYGQNDPRNPLRVRYDPSFGFGWDVVPGNYVNSPLHLAVLYSEWDCGIGNRLNGVAVYNHGSGNYTAPTIS